MSLDILYIVFLRGYGCSHVSETVLERFLVPQNGGVPKIVGLGPFKMIL